MPPPACWACARTMTYEGQAAMLLETLAHRFGACLPLPGGYSHRYASRDGLSVLNLYPLLMLVDEQRRLPTSMIEGLVRWVDAARGIRRPFRRFTAHPDCRRLRSSARGLAQPTFRPPASPRRWVVLAGAAACKNNRLLIFNIGLRQGSAESPPGGWRDPF
jgi:hypothetical protein